jgi:hypothetical protein
MASWHYSDITTLVTPAGTIGFNSPTGDTLMIDPQRSSGLGYAQVRAPIIHRGQTDGYTLLPFFLEGQHLVLAGDVVIRSATSEAGVVSARNTLLTTTRTRLKSILQADGTLNFGAGDALSVRCEMLIQPMGAWRKSFVLGLVSAAAP